MNQASKIKLDGVYTEDFGIEAQGRYDVPTAEPDIEYIYIKGRHGELTKKYGYKDTELSVVFSINRRWKGGTFKSIFRRVKLHIFEAEIFEVDDDPEVFHKIKSAQIEEAENMIRKFGEFTVTFTLAPFAYEVDNEPQTITTETTITNLGYESEPMMTAHASGTGNIYINDQEVTIKDINGTITIDSELQNAYRNESGSLENLNSHMIGDFPILEHGENKISFDGDISRIELTTNWRWV